MDMAESSMGRRIRGPSWLAAELSGLIRVGRRSVNYSPLSIPPATEVMGQVCCRLAAAKLGATCRILGDSKFRIQMKSLASLNNPHMTPL